MPPTGLAILIGAGPTSGAGIARVLATQGNMAVALLARNPDNLNSLCSDLRKSTNGGILHPFPTDTTPASLQKTFAAIKSHKDFQDLKLKLAIFHVKHALKGPYLETSAEEFSDALNTYTVGAFEFGRLALEMMYAQNGGETSLSETGGEKKGTIIYTGTLGALRANSSFAGYGATRAGARMIAQALAKEHSKNGVHVAHCIANGGIRDEDSEETRTGVKMKAESVGKAYLWLSQQDVSLWVHEMDLRPAQEKF